MSEDRTIVTMPVMYGVPAIVRQPFGFLEAPKTDESTVTVGAAPVEGSAALFVGLMTAEGEALIGCIPRKNINAFVEEMNRAISQIVSGSFDAAFSGSPQ